MAKAGKKQQQQVQNLIPGLPDEIAMECLVRVPYKFHNEIKSVCQRWLNLISSRSLYRERIKSGKAEQLVCQVQPLPPPSSHLVFDSASVTGTSKKQQDDGTVQNQRQVDSPLKLQYGLTIFNASNQTWQRIRPNFGVIPMFCQSVAIPSSGKVLLLGGWDPTTLEPVPDVYVLDLIKKNPRWRRAAPMSVARSFFACAVVGASTVYVAGGHDGHKNALKSAEMYDVEADEWRMLPEMEDERDECQGICLGGADDDRFFVVSGYDTESQGRFKSDAECYDPVTGCWSKLDNVWPFPSISPRGSTATCNGQQQQRQWLWFLGKQHQQLLQSQHREGGMEKGEIVTSVVPLPNCVTDQASPCVAAAALDDDPQKQRVFVMTGNGGRGIPPSPSSFLCNECEGEGAFIMERDTSNGNIKWNHVHLPVAFSGFPYSVSCILI